jgi:hypothetical protein
MRRTMDLIITVICISIGAIIGIKIGFLIADWLIWIIKGV